MATRTLTAPIPSVRGVTAVDTSIADPAPLGLAAFALTTFVLSCANAGILGKGGDAVVLGLALAYGGVAQFAAGMWEFKRNNTFGATAFTSYGAFWVSFALLITMFIGKIPPATVPSAVGVFLLAWTIFTLYMTAAAAKASRPVFVVFVVLSLTFIALTLGAFLGNAGLTQAGGYFGILTAFAAWYASARGVFASFP